MKKLDQALTHLRQLLVVADGLKIENMPIVLNPELKHPNVYLVAPGHRLCVTETHELHMSSATYTRLAIPNEFKGLCRLAESLKLQLRRGGGLK